MKRFLSACLVAAGFALTHLQPAAAEGARFRYLMSVYFDAQGVGLNLPEGVACGSNGQVVVGDTGNNRLLRFTYADKSVSGGREIEIPEVSAPSRVRLNSKEEIYALDGSRRRIVHLSRDGEFKGALEFEGVPPPATVVPKDFVIDAADNIYVLDVFSSRVLVLNAAAQFQRALPLPAAAAFGSGLAVDAAGSLLLLDSIGRRMFSAGKDATSFAALGGDLTAFVSTLPTYMTASKGTIFVVEGEGSGIVGFGSDGAFLTRQLTMGWTEGALNHPSQMCISEKDEVFVADRDNSRIQVFQLMR